MVWQKVNICISRTISNFPTKSWLYYDHGRLPKDASYIKRIHLIHLCLKTVRRAPSDHERENWIIHIVYSQTFPSQIKFTRRAVHNFSIFGDSGHSTEIPAWMCSREEERKPNPRTSLWSRDVEAQLGMLGSTGKHHLKTYRVWAFLGIFGKIQESCHRFFSDAAMLCGFHLKTGYWCFSPGTSYFWSATDAPKFVWVAG